MNLQNWKYGTVNSILHLNITLITFYPLNNWKVNCRYFTLQDISHHVPLRNRDILLHNYNTIFIFKKFNTDILILSDIQPMFTFLVEQIGLSVLFSFKKYYVTYIVER